MKVRLIIGVMLALTVVAFVALHLDGARSSVGILSGSATNSEETTLGIAYALLWFAVVVVVPIIALTLVFEYAWRRAVRARRARRDKAG